MVNPRNRTFCGPALLSILLLWPLRTLPQNPQMQEKLANIEQAMAANKQKLAQYTWQETETISIKGNVKDVKTYQVQMGPNGQQKTLLSDQKAQSGGRDGRLKQRIVEKKKEEYADYGQQIGALAKEYTTPDPGRLRQAKQQGNVSLQPGNGTISLVIKSFVKPNDQVTFTISDETKAPISANIQSYLNDPSDAVTITAQFAQLPDGTNHVASVLINGESKQLTVNQQNSNYQKM